MRIKGLKSEFYDNLSHEEKRNTIRAFVVTFLVLYFAFILIAHTVVTAL
jgi:hypothetical protein